MKPILIALALTALSACGSEYPAEVTEQDPAPVKNITQDTLPNYYADRIELVPTCSQPCEVLQLQDGSKFFCTAPGTDWVPVGAGVRCELSY